MSLKSIYLMVRIIVFKLGLVQGPGSGFWSGRPGQFLFQKNSKRHHFSKKNKSQRVATGFLTGFCRVNWVTESTGRVVPGHDFFYFFFNSARFQPRIGRVLGQPTGPGRILKLWLELTMIMCHNNVSVFFILN